MLVCISFAGHPRTSGCYILPSVSFGYGSIDVVLGIEVILQGELRKQLQVVMADFAGIFLAGLVIGFRNHIDGDVHRSQDTAQSVGMDKIISGIVFQLQFLVIQTQTGGER